MIRELRQLNQEVWAKILASHLQKYKSENLDASYRHDLYQISSAEQKRQKKLLREKKKEMNTELVSVDLHQRYSNVLTRKSREQSIKKMSRKTQEPLKKLLETTDILEETQIPSVYKNMSSLKIVQEKTQDRTQDGQSFVNMSASSHHSFSSNNDSNSSSFVSNKGLEEYRSNTVINQLGLIHSYDSGSILESSNSEEVKACILYYKEVTNAIERHLGQERNIFKQLINLFESNFVGKYQKIFHRLNKSGIQKQQISKTIEAATADLQNFIRILCDGINLFYDLHGLKQGKISTGYTAFNYDNVTNFVTTLVFNEKIYNLIFKVYKLEYHDVEKLYRSKLESYCNLEPQELGVPDEFCLNERTIEYLRKKVLPTQKGIEVPRNFSSYNKENENYSQEKSNISVKDSQLSKVSSSVLESKMMELIEYRPYEKAIAILKEFNHQRSPIHKFKNILKVVECITMAIDEFYKSLNLKANQNLSGDQTFAIFCFIIAKSQVKNVLASCKIINEFGTTTFKKSDSGYYAATLEACVAHITDCPCINKLDETIEVL